MRRVIAAISALCCALLAAPAWAGSGDAVIRDCAQHGKLTRTYTQAQYADALANLPADLDEYSNCRQVISAAKRKASQGGGTTGTTGGGGTPTGGGTSGGGGAPPSPDSSTPGSATGPPVFNGGGPNAPAGGDAGGSAGGAATPSQPSVGSAGADLSRQQAEADAAAREGAPGRANLDLTGVTPATATASRTGAGALPTPVLVALIVLVVAALAALGWVAKRRLPALADLPRLRRVLPRRGA
jgi:hypothetical protein